jgi:hypothetical protein
MAASFVHERPACDARCTLAVGAIGMTQRGKPSTSGVSGSGGSSRNRQPIKALRKQGLLLVCQGGGYCLLATAVTVYGLRRRSGCRAPIQDFLFRCAGPATIPHIGSRILFQFSPRVLPCGWWWRAMPYVGPDTAWTDARRQPLRDRCWLCSAVALRSGPAKPDCEDVLTQSLTPLRPLDQVHRAFFARAYRCCSACLCRSRTRGSAFHR